MGDISSRRDAGHWMVLYGFAPLYHQFDNQSTKNMELYLSKESKMGAVQAEFSDAFPGLKIAFFSKPHGESKGSSAKFMLQHKDMLLGDISTDLQAGTLAIHPESVVWSVESDFEKVFGLHVQIFRKSGSLWLETSVTDHLTLAEQMQKAADTEHIHAPIIDPMDYREKD